MGLKKFIRQGSERFRIKPLYNHVQNKELREAVKMFEIDRKGKVWTKDLGKILRCIGWNPSESELEEARKELEVRVKGQILYHDLEHYVAKRTAQSMECVETDLQEAFKALGNKGDGKISVKNFRRFMTTLGEKMAPDEVEELLRDAKATEQDCIDYRQLLEALELSS